MEKARQSGSPVPPEAVFDPASGLWELLQRDERGQLNGECRRFRADGTLVEVCQYQAGVPIGPFVVFHPNGQTARTGTFAAGVVDGCFFAYASDEPTPEALRACCVPANAWELRARYARGRVLREVFHDREGRPLLADGSLQPPRPATVPPASELDETDQRWVLGQVDEAGNRQGAFQFWNLDGRLTDEHEYRDGQPVLERLYDQDGRVVEESRLGDEHLRHGNTLRRFSRSESPYANSLIREERGSFDRGRSTGVWTLHDENGTVVATVDLGLPLDEDRAAESPALARNAPDGASEQYWMDLAADLRRQRRVREALCAATRAAARQGDTHVLLALLSETTLPLARVVSEERGNQIAQSSSETLTSVLDALMTGVAPATVFGALASVLESAHPASLDCINVSLLLDSGRHKSYMTRALIRIEQGDDQGALADMAEVARESPDEARMLRDHMRPYFPEYSFWPARERLDALDPAIAEPGAQVPAQPLSAVRHMIQVYATRLSRLRAAVSANVRAAAPDAAKNAVAPRVPEPVWMPPDTAALLPDGPVSLRRMTIKSADEPEPDAVLEDAQEPETLEIQIDEDLTADTLQNASVAGLLTMARANWSALTWLCWACGLDSVALPDAITPPTEFAAAVAWSVFRCFRAHDRWLTGGVRGMARGLPGLVWEGVEIDQMPHHLAQIMAAETLEVRSMFLWLVVPDALSPFQDDLREA